MPFGVVGIYSIIVAEKSLAKRCNQKNKLIEQRMVIKGTSVYNLRLINHLVQIAR